MRTRELISYAVKLISPLFTKQEQFGLMFKNWLEILVSIIIAVIGSYKVMHGRELYLRICI